MKVIKKDLLLWFIIFFDEKSKGSGFNIQVKYNEQLAKEIFRNF